MRKSTLPTTAVLGAMLALSLPAAPVQAQLRHTWVASNGSDIANCGRPTPCATLVGAFAKTIPGGEITCVDSGNFGGSLDITRSVTINCENAIGSNTASGGNSISIITVNTAATDVVTLRGLDLDGKGVVVSGLVGLINFVGAGVLRVDKIKINNLRGAAAGIRFGPGGPARLEVSDSFIADNGTDLTTAGILIRPRSGGSANVSVSRTDLLGNVNGIYVNGSGGGGAVNLSMRDSRVTGSSNVGIVLATPGPAVSALIERTTVTSSLNIGVAASGAAAIARISDATIYGNVKGVAVFNGATLRSYKNNRINGNGTDGTPLPAEGFN